MDRVLKMWIWVLGEGSVEAMSGQIPNLHFISVITEFIQVSLIHSGRNILVIMKYCGRILKIYCNDTCRMFQLYCFRYRTVPYIERKSINYCNMVKNKFNRHDWISTAINEQVWKRCRELLILIKRKL